MQQYKVGIIGGTGMVGQRFITLMENHPWFRLTAIAASSRSAGKPYEEAVAGRWALDIPMPEEAKKIMVLDAEADAEKLADMVDFVFCAVDMKKEDIRALEERYAKLECPVVSNNSAHRWTEDVPMVVPEINAEHLEVIDSQRSVWVPSAASSQSSPTALCRAMSPPCIPFASTVWTALLSVPIRQFPVPAKTLNAGPKWWITASPSSAARKKSPKRNP